MVIVNHQDCVSTNYFSFLSYDDAIPKCLAAVTVLVKKCQQYEANMSGNSGDQAKCLTYPTLSNNITDDVYRVSLKKMKTKWILLRYFFC